MADGSVRLARPWLVVALASIPTASCVYVGIETGIGHHRVGRVASWRLEVMETDDPGSGQMSDDPSYRRRNDRMTEQ
jgi:hypothetical protein